MTSDEIVSVVLSHQEIFLLCLGLDVLCRDARTSDEANEVSRLARLLRGHVPLARNVVADGAPNDK